MNWRPVSWALRRIHMTRRTREVGHVPLPVLYAPPPTGLFLQSLSRSNSATKLSRNSPFHAAVRGQQDFSAMQMANKQVRWRLPTRTRGEAHGWPPSSVLNPRARSHCRLSSLRGSGKEITPRRALCIEIRITSSLGGAPLACRLAQSMSRVVSARSRSMTKSRISESVSLLTTAPPHQVVWRRAIRRRTN